MTNKIEGREIYFLPITKDDTSLIVKWRNNSRVFNNFVFNEKFTEEMHENWLNTKVKSGEVVQFIICVKKTDRAIGSVYFRDIDYKKSNAEYGIFIGEDEAIGKGYGSETAALALKYAFDELKLESVFLRVFADNVSAIKSYEKAGFAEVRREEKAVTKGSITHDLIFMEIKKN